jgi:hypothetical protein
VSAVDSGSAFRLLEGLVDVLLGFDKGFRDMQTHRRILPSTTRSRPYVIGDTPETPPLW